jgi:hypothetical protein
MAFTGKQANEWVKPVIYITAAYLGWKYAISPLLEGLNLKDSKTDITQDKVIDKTETALPQYDYWRPGFHRLTKSELPSNVVKYWKPQPFTPYQNKAIAIWDATGFFNDVETQIYGVFRSLKYKTEVSYIAAIFQSKYNRDLYQFLKAYLNKEELATVLQITDKLPYGWILKNGKTM